MIHKVIYSLYPSATYINEDAQAFDAQGNLIELNMVTVNAEVAKLKAAYDAKEYQRLRNYPKIGDQLDMLWHAIDNGTLNKTSDFYTAIKAVKDAHPKE
jgi:hypothetical protein